MPMLGSLLRAEFHLHATSLHLIILYCKSVS